MANIGHKCELALPAGSLQCALQAFRGGADAVYFGLKSFSARHGAVNFSFDDVRKIRTYCANENKKFYIALNTLVDDREMDQVIPMLRQLEFVKPDGLIIQDLGIAKVVREHFPSLSIHASTQLAVHTVQGVKQLQAMGFSRVVLSRELSFEEISEIRQACPDIELKVFIHGALCYGFSGLCMASQYITGRSANCGTCAQICRTWFTCKDTGTDSWLFSMKDLCLGEKVREYEKIGIDSLKVEGRMKGPDYAYWCARYYRMLLDGKDESDQEVQWAKEAMQVSFSRETTQGFFDSGKNGSLNCDNMVCSTDPTHRGIQVGTIDKVLSSKAVIRFTKPVALRDGLKVVFGKESAGFSLSTIDGNRSFISEGETATINFPTSQFSKKPGFGTPVFCVSRHNLNMGNLNEELPMYKKPLDLSITVQNNAIQINGQFYPTEVQQARSDADILSIFRKVFESSDRSLFTLGNLELSNESGFSSPFIPMSVLKQIRRSFYEKMDSLFTESLESGLELQHMQRHQESLPPRKALKDWDEITEYNGRHYLVLSPLMFNETAYLEKLNSKVQQEPDLIVGLNNIAQVAWAKQRPEIQVFADVFLYAKNSLAYESLQQELPNLIGSYDLDRIDYVPPLFISRVCLRHNGLGLSCKGCARNNTFRLEQNGKHYKAKCRDCITIVTQEDWGHEDIGT